MQDWPLNIRILKKPRFIPLRYRVTFITSVLLILLLGSLALAIGLLQTRTIRQQSEIRGKAIAQSLVAASKKDLVNYNYIALEQFANQAVQDPDIVYVIFHDKEGRVAGYSDRPDLQGDTLDDLVSQNSLSADSTLLQPVTTNSGKNRGLDCSVPVFLAGSPQRWGTVRVCLSLGLMYNQLQQTISVIISVGLVALILIVIISMWGAQRITQPLGQLVQATIEAAKGNLNPNIRAKTGDEVEILSNNFSAMIKKILDHQNKQTAQLAEIKRLQKYTEKLLSGMYDGLLSVKTNGNIAVINPNGRELLGIPAQRDLSGDHFSTILREQSPLSLFIQGMLHNPHPRGQEEILIPENGGMRSLLVGSSLLYNEYGAPQEIIFTLHDISELKKLEARIRQTDRLAALGTLAAGMAHEIRNPLSAIKTFVQLLPRKIDKPGFLEKFNRTVPRETERINILIEELLELSKIPKYNFAFTDVHELLLQVLDSMSIEFQNHTVKCHSEISPDLPLVWADANQLVKAFHNLILNAIQAMPEGGQLSIAANYDLSKNIKNNDAPNSNGRITLKFSDTGVGIDTENLKTVFNPFFTTKDTGTGLGLAVTHKVITEHGGQIDAESEVGSGTQFIIYLPIRESHGWYEDIPNQGAS
jgi:two-component system, NtrC family, sensor histidine kinase AtoS